MNNPFAAPSHSQSHPSSPPISRSSRRWPIKSSLIVLVILGLISGSYAIGYRHGEMTRPPMIVADAVPVKRLPPTSKQHRDVGRDSLVLGLLDEQGRPVFSKPEEETAATTPTPSTMSPREKSEKSREKSQENRDPIPAQSHHEETSTQTALRPPAQSPPVQPPPVQTSNEHVAHRLNNGTANTDTSPPNRQASPQFPIQTNDAAAGQKRHFIQLASLSDREKSLAFIDKIIRENNDLLGNIPIEINEKDIPGRGRFYRIQAGPLSGAAQAQTLCQRLNALKQDCFVLVIP